MDLFTFLVITYSLIDSSKCLEETTADAFGLQILSDSAPNGQNTILKHVDDSLNLSCRVQQANKLTSNKSNIPSYKLSWKLPHLTHNSQNRVVENSSVELDGWQLLVENLKESDTGDYECLAHSTTSPGIVVAREAVRVNVKNKKTHCGGSQLMFLCPLVGNCIIRSYLCDGVRDCHTGADEHESLCGPNACEGKIQCVDNLRCIPVRLCCDPHSDPNCTLKTRHDCCPPVPKRLYPLSELTKFSEDDQQQRLHNDEHQRFSDMGFLQTTIYTVIGCAMAFMFIVTILVIAICRVHMKRTLLSRCPNARNVRGSNARGRNAHHGVAHMPLYDLDVFLNRGSPFPSEMSPHSGLLVTYNINNGVQFVGRPVDPPPYCEIVASPPREGPPPPYVSHENLRATHEPRDGDSGDAAGETDALLSRGGNTLRITVVNTAPRGGEGPGGDGGRYRLVALGTRPTSEDDIEGGNEAGPVSAGEARASSESRSEPRVLSEPGSEPRVSSEQRVLSESRNEPRVSSESRNVLRVLSEPGSEPRVLSEPRSKTTVSSEPSCAPRVLSEPRSAPTVSNEPTSDATASTQQPTTSVEPAASNESPPPNHTPCDQAQLRKNFFGLGATAN